MVRDLMLNIPEGDLRTEDKSNASEPVFDVTWEDFYDEDLNERILICNIIIPEIYKPLIAFKDDELILRFKAEYHPSMKHFNIRPMILKEDGTFETLFLTGAFGASAVAYIPYAMKSMRISSAQLVCLDTEGQYLTRIEKPQEDGLMASTAYIYSSKETDIEVSYSDNQAAQLLSLCAPGKSYRYPSTGVGITSYLNSVIDHTNFNEILEKQFEADGKPLRSATFDSSNCDLDVLYSPETEKPDTDLADISELDLAFFGDFKDTFMGVPSDIPDDEPDEPTGGEEEPTIPDDDPIIDLPITVPTTDKLLYRYVNRGEFDNNEDYYYKEINPETNIPEISLVYNLGCQWMCKVNGTKEEPKYPTKDWAMVIGNNSFRIRFIEPQQVFEVPDFDTTLTIEAFLGWMEITNELPAENITWYRYSEDHYGQQRKDSDEIWNLQKGKSGKQLHLTLDDLSIDSGGLPGKVVFRAEATLYKDIKAKTQYSFV